MHFVPSAEGGGMEITMKKEAWITGIICIVFIVAAGGLYLFGDFAGASEGNSFVAQNSEWHSENSDGENGYSDSAGEKKDVEAAEAPEQAHEGCAVFICGAVKHPGVYEFSTDSRVCDAIEAAGGFTKKADTNAINQARFLVDGEQITIPRKGKKKKSTGSERGGADGSSEGLVNINEADVNQLMTLSGIGQAKAQLIVDFRQENGPFTKTEDIMNISGIKDGIYNQIKDQITV